MANHEAAQLAVLEELAQVPVGRGDHAHAPALAGLRGLDLNILLLTISTKCPEMPNPDVLISFFLSTLKF